ncbi:MAG: TolC family protein, partial [Pseudomonadota bacterium]
MRMVKHITLMITLATFPGLGHGESLKDALRSAYEHSGLLQQNRALLRAADENVAQAVAGLRPVVSWVANAQYARSQTGVLNTGGDSAVRSSNLTVQAEWLLYDFGRTS